MAPGFWGYADDTVPERNGDARTLLAAEPPAVAHGLSGRAGSKKNRNAMKTTAAEPDMLPGMYQVHGQRINVVQE